MLIIGNFRDVPLRIGILVVFTYAYITKADDELKFYPIQLDFKIAQWYHNLFMTFVPSSIPEQQLENENKTSGDACENELSNSMRQHRTIIRDKIKNGNTAEKLAIRQLQMLAFFKGLFYASCALVTNQNVLTPFPYCREMSLNFFNFSLLDGQALSDSITLSKNDKIIVKSGYEATYTLVTKYKSDVEKVRKTEDIQKEPVIHIGKSDESFYNDELFKEKEFNEPHIVNLMKLIEGQKNRLTPLRNYIVETSFEKLPFNDAENLWQNVEELYFDSFTKGEFDHIKALKSTHKHYLIKLKLIRDEEVEILDGIEGKKFDIKSEKGGIRIVHKSKKESMRVVPL